MSSMLYVYLGWKDTDIEATKKAERNKADPIRSGCSPSFCFVTAKKVSPKNTRARGLLCLDGTLSLAIAVGVYSGEIEKRHTEKCPFPQDKAVEGRQRKSQEL